MKPNSDEAYVIDSNPKATSTQLCQKVNPFIDFLIFLVMEMEDDHAFFVCALHSGESNGLHFSFPLSVRRPTLGQLATPGFVMREKLNLFASKLHLAVLFETFTLMSDKLQTFT